MSGLFFNFSLDDQSLFIFNQNSSINPDQSKMEIGKELRKWAQLLLAIMSSLIILQLSLIDCLPQFTLVAPFFLFDAKQILLLTLDYKKKKNIETPERLLAFKEKLIFDLLHNIGNVLFYVLLVIYFITKSFSLTWTTVPLFFCGVLKFCVKSRFYHKCEMFAESVKFI